MPYIPLQYTLTDSLQAGPDSTWTDSLPPIDTTLADSLNVDSMPEKKPMFTDIITYTATDSTKFSVGDKRVFLYGDGAINYTTIDLKSEYIELNMDKNEAFASGVEDSTGKLVGTPVFSDHGQEFESKELRYNFKSGKGFVKDIVTQEGEGYVQGKLTKRMSDSIYCIKDGWYTTCDHHDHPHFYIHMSKAKMIKDKKVVTGYSYLVFEDVPIKLLCIPFGFFPISKKGTSGIIMPTYGDEKARGLNLRDGGFYWAISDYMDMSITGDIYTNGSWGLEIGSNYKVRYRYSGNFAASMSRNHVSEKDLPDYTESSDWSLNWTHSQDPKANPYRTFSASVNMSSATNNQYNAMSLNDIANQRKSSSVSWSKKWPDRPFSLSASFNHNQNSQDSTISISFPNVNFKVSNIYPFRKSGKTSNLQWYDNIGFSYSAELKNMVNTKEDVLLKTPLTQWSNGFRHSIPLSISIPITKSIAFSPSISYTGVLYTKYVEQSYLPDMQTVLKDTIYGLKYAHNYSASASMSYSPKVYGYYIYKPGSKVQAIRHVISPSASISYSPAIGMPYNSYYRAYIGADGTQKEYSIFQGQPYSVSRSPKNGSGSVSLSLDNNVEMKVRNDNDTTGTEEGASKKIKLLESLRLSTSYDLFADSMNWSRIQLSARTSIMNGKMGFNLSGTVDPYAVDVNGNRRNRFAGGLGRLTNLSASTGFQFAPGNNNSTTSSNSSEENQEVAPNMPPRPSGGYFDQYMDFKMPWSLSIDYTMSYSRTWRRNLDPGATKAAVSSSLQQNFRVNGSLSLTAKWRLSFQTGYDVAEQAITSTSFSVTRDLHCWDMSFYCIPFGAHQSYNFQINVRSSTLRDLKFTKRDSWLDN